MGRNVPEVYMAVQESNLGDKKRLMNRNFCGPVVWGQYQRELKDYRGFALQSA